MYEPGIETPDYGTPDGVRYWQAARDRQHKRVALVNEFGPLAQFMESWPK